MTSLPPLDDKSPAESALAEEATSPSANKRPPGGFPDEGERFVQMDESEQIRLVGDDYAAAYRLEREGVFDPYPGEWVAVLRGEFIGHSTDCNPTALRQNLAVARNVHPERIAMIYIDDPKEAVWRLLIRAGAKLGVPARNVYSA